MKKIKLGPTEVLGLVGIMLWIAIILLREYPLSGSDFYWFVLGILPNLAPHRHSLCLSSGPRYLA